MRSARGPSRVAGAAWVLIAASFAAAAGPAVTVLEGPTMGTVWRVSIAGAGPVDERHLREMVIEPVLERTVRSMSGWSRESEVSRLNRSASGGWLAVSEDLFGVALLAQSVGARTGGAFDLTVSPLVALWGFGPRGPGPRVPTADAIAQAMRHVGPGRFALRRDPPALVKADPGVALDFSGIAKGNAVDAVSEALARAGHPRHLVDIGGELRGRGAGPRDRPWRVAVEQPRDGEPRAALVVALDDAAIATSGDYRQYFEVDGRRYSHTIDPRTGRPVSHGLAAVSVIRPRAAEADALATALMVLGPAEGLALARREGWAVLMIERRGGGFVRHETEAFARRRIE